MSFLAMDRTSRGLRWAGGLLLLAGVTLVVAAIGWTQTADALVTASAIAALAFGLPGFLAYVLAYWLDDTAGRLEKTRPLPVIGVADVAAAAHLTVDPFRAPLPGYAIAVAAVLVAWGIRAALDAVIPQQTPFITFFLAVALAGWLGGFGPAALATFLSLLVAWAFFLTPSMNLRLGNLGVATGLGLFVFVCLGIGAITAALRTALTRAQYLAAEATHQAAMLRESQGRLRVMADIAPVLIWMSDTTKACIYFNETWLQFTGRTLQQELGNGWAEGVHPDDLARCLSIYESAFDRRAPFTMEYRLRGADGSFRVVRDMGIARFDASGTFAGYVGACMDVTDLVSAPLTDEPRIEPGRVAGVA